MEKVGKGIKPDTPEYASFMNAYSTCDEAEPDKANVFAQVNIYPPGQLKQGSRMAFRPLIEVHKPDRSRGPYLVDAAWPVPEHSFELDFNSMDEGSVDLLYGLVRGLRPLNVLETGTHRGRSTAAIAAALVANKQGHLWTIDAVDFDLEHSGALTPEQQEAVTCVFGLTPTVLNRPPLSDLAEIDFAFLDGDHSEAGVQAELAYVEQRMAPECWVAVDNARDPGWPELEAMFRKFTTHPHVNIETMTGMEVIHLKRE